MYLSPTSSLLQEYDVDEVIRKIKILVHPDIHWDPPDHLAGTSRPPVLLNV